MRAYTAHTYAESTKAVYKSQMLAYLRFCIFYGHEPVPATQSTILSYTAFLARSLSPASIKNYLNLIRIIHLESGFENPLADNYALKNLKRGITRLKGTPPKQMLPFTCAMLLDIRRHLCFLFPSDVKFWAAVCVAFFGFLRKSTLLPISPVDPGESCLLKGDLEFTSTCSFKVNIRRTKTIQNNERILILPYIQSPRSEICPVDAVKNTMYLAPNDPRLPLFAYRENGVVRWWTHKTFTNRLRCLLKRAGYKSDLYSCHSFRRGGASLAFKLGLTRTEIKKRGDWRSHAVDEYVILDSAQDEYIAWKLVSGASEMWDLV